MGCLLKDSPKTWRELFSLLEKTNQLDKPILIKGPSSDEFYCSTEDSEFFDVDVDLWPLEEDQDEDCPTDPEENDLYLSLYS